MEDRTGAEDSLLNTYRLQFCMSSTSNAFFLAVPFLLLLSVSCCYGLERAIRRRVLFSSGDLPAPSPPAALGPPELRGEPGSIGGWKMYSCRSRVC